MLDFYYQQYHQMLIKPFAMWLQWVQAYAMHEQVERERLAKRRVR